MSEVLICLCLVEWLANDLHYNSHGANFYALHLLADRVKDYGSADDDIKEVYYLGCKDTTPPLDREISVEVCKRYDGIVAANDGLIKCLLSALVMLQDAVNSEKNDSSLTGGVHSILDEISKKTSQNIFLVRAQIDDAATV